MKKIYKKFYKKAKEVYANEKTGHDINHIKRVLNFEKQICKKEKCNNFVLTIATMFHDVHRVMYNELNKFVTAEESVEYVKEILSEFNLNKNDLDKILYLVKMHDEKYIELTKDNIELKILQDADILDALGNNGLKRTLKFCKTKNIPIYNKDFSLECSEYVPEIKPLSTTHYVYRTMAPQAELIKTEVGKTLAKKQMAPLYKFVNNNIKKHNLKIR